MIRSLILGKINDIEYYSNLITASKYYGESVQIPLNINNTMPSEIKNQEFDAILIVSPAEELMPFLTEQIKAKSNIYFVDQPSLNTQDLQLLLKLHQESGNLFYFENGELQHPLVEDFISTQGRHLMFRYNKTINNKKQIRSAILSALCFLYILSPMQVKSININTIETTNDNKPTIKIRLKLFDSSIAFILLKFENKIEHNIMLELKSGCFTFNFADNYLENIHGKRFTSKCISTDQLLLKSLEEFALHIILNNHPTFNFYHYSLSFNTLTRIENILKNSF